MSAGLRKWGERLLFPPVWAAGLACAFFPAELWLFRRGYASRWFAYVIYVGSAYALAVLCARLTRWLLARRKSPGRTAEAPEEQVGRLRRTLYQGLALNLGYAVFFLASAVWQGSAWLGANGVYCLVLAAPYGVLARYRRHLAEQYDPLLAWLCYTVIGWLLLGLNLTMTACVILVIRRGVGKSYPGMLVLGVAALTFYKLGASIFRLARQRRRNAPIQGALSSVQHTGALMSLFMLQTALFSAFGQGFDAQDRINTLTGAGVCAMTVLGAAGMVRHGSRRMRETQGGANGKQGTL